MRKAEQVASNPLLKPVGSSGGIVSIFGYYNYHIQLYTSKRFALHCCLAVFICFCVSSFAFSFSLHRLLELLHLLCLQKRAPASKRKIRSIFVASVVHSCCVWRLTSTYTVSEIFILVSVARLS